jgi:alkanesulfonate monooxygenase SsuD/methylene tetrahydromethanopterin reductase-like flavin-dependent oxidoreductase (luciferase family)
MLTSSGESAYLAAHFGMSLSFAQFINPVGGPEAVAAYHKLFKGDGSQTPRASVSVFAFCGDTEEKAEQVQAVMDYRLLSIERGKIDEAPSYEAIKDYTYSREEWARVQYNRMRMITGTPDVIKEKITKLAEQFGVDEVMIATFADYHEDRLRSYTLLAEQFSLVPAPEAIMR